MMKSFSEEGVNGQPRAAPTEDPPRRDANGVPRSLHRIRQVRRRQGVSLRTAARRWSLEIAEVRRQQDEKSDLTLSELYQWQELLNVPVEELLVDCGLPLSSPVMRRAQLLKLMKTAMTIQEQSREKPTQRLVGMLIDQLLEIMPELAEVGPWHGNGSRRTLDDLGRAAEYGLSEECMSA